MSTPRADTAGVEYGRRPFQTDGKICATNYGRSMHTWFHT